ncbi:MAG TPA: hypothetical protein VGQ08_00020 [Nitrospiraceae bacterium]|jgi:hypothetical protein|nr:hypothetical protein [Nitrospiraceae bacterium]
MTQEIFLWALVAGLVVFTWVMAHAGFGDDHHTRDYQHGSASPEHCDREEPHDDSPQQ